MNRFKKYKKNLKNLYIIHSQPTLYVLVCTCTREKNVSKLNYTFQFLVLPLHCILLLSSIILTKSLKTSSLYPFSWKIISFILIADTSQGGTVRTVQYCIKTKQNFLVLCNVHSFNSRNKNSFKLWIQQVSNKQRGKIYC